MKTLSASLGTLLILVALPACRDASRTDAWLGDVTAVISPAGPCSRYPHLGAGAGQIVLSWLQAQEQGGFALQHARWQDGAWGAAATVTSGDDWFINWADFPSVVPVGTTTWQPTGCSRSRTTSIPTTCASPSAPIKAGNLTRSMMMFSTQP